MPLERPDTRRLIALGHYSDNPWQNINYSRLQEHGVAVHLRDFDDDLTDVGPGDVVHVNWTAPLSQGAATPDAADAAVLRAIDRLRRATLRGGRLLSTVHNRMPHELAFPDAELLLQRAIATMADRIHVMHERTADLLDPSVRLSEDRVIHIPHPSYTGWYPERRPREHARASLGIPVDAPVVVSVGAMRGYKGLQRLVEAFDVWKLQQPNARLIVGGRPGGSVDHAMLEALHRRDDVEIVLDHLDDDRLALLLSAADMMALPYADGLNSGVLALAATFGLPTVVSDIPAAEPYRGSPWLRTFSHGDGWLADAAADARWRASGSAALATAGVLHPSRIAERFAALVSELLDDPAGAAAWRHEARKVGIVVVNYRSSSLLAPCLDPLVGRHDIVVVDSRSEDSERDAVERWARSTGVTALPLDRNPGFGAAANAGARLLLDKPGIEAILLLNPDVVTDADAIAALCLSALSAPDAMVSATITTSDGRPWFQGGLIDLSLGLARHRRQDEQRPPDWLTAACLVVPRAAMREGFPSGWFLYWEDVALTYRWRQRGGRLLVDPVVVAHAVGGTQQALGSSKSFDYSYWNARNRLRFAASELGGRQLLRWLHTTPSYVDELVARAAPVEDGARRRHRRAAWRGGAAGVADAGKVLLRRLSGR